MRRRYEYVTKYLKLNELDAELNAFGKDGWRLVHISLRDPEAAWEGYEAIFEREVPDGC